MGEIKKALDTAVSKLSDQNYAKSFAFCRVWIGIGQRYHQIPPHYIIDSIWNNRATDSIVPRDGKLIHPTAHLALRLARDAESDHFLAPFTSGFQSRLSIITLREFFANNMRAAHSDNGSIGCFYAEANLIAHLANFGYVEEDAIRHQILQSLISHEKLHDHQADALIILFKLAGATFEAYADPLVVDRCFELLNGHSYDSPYRSRDVPHNVFGGPYRGGHDNGNVKKKLIQVRVPPGG